MGSIAGRDSKSSEKEYLRRTAAGSWERLKPFSPAGTDTLAESASLIQDFAAAVTHLPPAPSDLILDLGAGACWCSDWLQRLNRRTVSIDISWDMLRLGRTRVPQAEGAALVAGDLEYLPFAAGSFDKAYCLSAIHHIPDIRRAVREIHRVLKPDGAALFSEPGVGHADKPASVSAMRDFGVLEQDIVIAEFMDACRTAGFADVRLKPLSYANPAIDLTADQWESWRRLARSKRPARAARKIWRAVLELLGIGKQDQLFEEAFAMTLVRVLRSAMEDHPVIVASRVALGSSGPVQHRARIQLLSAPSAADVGGTMKLRVRLVNAGPTAWQTASPSGSGYVRLGIQLLDADLRLVNRDYHREPLPRSVSPGQQIEWEFACPAPPVPGVHHLKLDLVVEGVSWFEAGGSDVVVRRLETQGR
jgi:ubiquinone/menaquinone biosynthesis C-methylase UbiE